MQTIDLDDFSIIYSKILDLKGEVGCLNIEMENGAFSEKYLSYYYVQCRVRRFFFSIFDHRLQTIPFRWAFDSPGPGYFKTVFIFRIFLSDLRIQSSGTIFIYA